MCTITALHCTVLRNSALHTVHDAYYFIHLLCSSISSLSVHTFAIPFLHKLWAAEDLKWSSDPLYSLSNNEIRSVPIFLIRASRPPCMTLHCIWRSVITMSSRPWWVRAVLTPGWSSERSRHWIDQCLWDLNSLHMYACGSRGRFSTSRHGGGGERLWEGRAVCLPGDNEISLHTRRSRSKRKKQISWMMTILHLPCTVSWGCFT